MHPQPTRLCLTPQNQLAIDWDDGQQRIYEIAQLRRDCPCATCRAETPKGSDSTEPLLRESELSIVCMDPVGNYAYRIQFSDGHDTGIYTLELLRRLGTPSTP